MIPGLAPIAKFFGGKLGSSLLSIGGGILGDFLGADQQQDFNAEEAEKGRKWNEYMSNTAYQRAAKDLEAAGLNRVLAYGSPASSPSSAIATMSQPTYGKTGIASASAKQSIDQSRAEENFLKQRESESKATEALAISNAVTATTQADLNKANEMLARETARLRSAEATKEERFTPIYDKTGSAIEAIIKYLEGKMTSNATDARDDKPGIFGRGLKSLQDAIESKMRDADDWYKRRIPIHKRGD